MIGAIIFVVSVVACGQFVVLYWRAMLHEMATQPISDRIRVAMGISSRAVGAQDFRSILDLYDMAPDLRGPSKALSMIRSYYWAVDKVAAIAPALKGWAEAEMATCSRYAAVLVDQQLERNMACAAEMRSL
jgi:hypothetical protein